MSPPGARLIPPQKNPRIPPQKKPRIPPQKNLRIPPQKNLRIPPQKNPRIPPQKNLRIPPQKNPRIPPQKNLRRGKKRSKAPFLLLDGPVAEPPEITGNGRGWTGPSNLHPPVSCVILEKANPAKEGERHYAAAYSHSRTGGPAADGCH